MLKENDIIEGQINGLAFGGEGILRHRGFVIFIPFTAPGDTITCRITEVKKSFAKGEIVSIQKPGPQRTTPPCPYFGPCGGCQIQHLNEQAQLKYKLDAVKDALARIGHLYTDKISITPARLMWAYRRHITLHLRPHKEGFEAGYISNDNRSLVVIKTCPIFNPKGDPVIEQLQELVKSIPNPSKREGRVTVLKNHRNQYILSFNFGNDFKIDQSLFKRILQHYPIFAGIIVSIEQDKTYVFEDPYTELYLEGLTFRITPQTFIQNHPEQSTNIYNHICQIISEKSHKKILDLYCGFGITSLLLAKQGHHVTGIEYNKEAINLAKENAAFNRLYAQFIQGDVERLLPKLTKEQEFQTIVVNPPRTGLAKGVVQSLLKIASSEIIYVSCMPATLARDLSLLCKEVYQIRECKVYDMFPQTAHVETLVYLTKKV